MSDIEKDNIVYPINISVKDKVARPVNAACFIVCGNSNYVLKFSFDEEWAAYEEKTAYFISNGVTLPPVIFQGDECPVPKLSNTTSVSVGVSAGDLSTTTKVVIPCRKSIRCESSEPQEPTPDVYARIMQMINDGKIKGEQGEKGERGEKGEQGEKGATGAKIVSLEKVSESIDSVVYEMTFDDGTVFSFTIPKGEQGERGEKGDTGEKGEQGEPFTYEDFTAEQLAALKGEKGDKGDTGATGATGERGIQGERGEQGIQGIQGIQGVQGEKGADGKDGLNGKDGQNGLNGKDGQDGYTPVKGVDYWTEADKAYIIEQAKIGVTSEIETVLDEIIAIQNALIGTPFEELHEYAQSLKDGGEV